MTTPSFTDCGSESYSQARTVFLHACADAGAELRSYRHPLPGPDGAALFLDEARCGPAEARRVLFVASGTHGIEGFCGSAIQTFLLRTHLTRRLPADVALVLVHAVNPWGFAWRRRVNEDNVDVNRNFLDHTAPHPENPDYDRLYDALNPVRLDEATVASGLGALRRFEHEHGPEASYRALSGGQYRHPQGVQYGGCEPVWSNRVLRRVWTRHARYAELAVYVDLHSGLGPCGTGLLLQTAAEESIGAQLARTWWPDVIRSAPARATNAALASGLIGPAFVAAHPDAAAVAAVLEFGTRDFTEVILAVQADNWLHHHGDRDSEVGRAIGQRMRDAFFVDDGEWKTRIFERAQEIVHQTLAGMAAFAPQPVAAATPRVRLALPSDREVLIAFNVEMARETEGRELSLETLHAGVTALLADPTRGRVFVVESEGEVVATLMLTLEWSDWRNGYFWWIQSVYVSPAHRRRGHYRRLHEHVRRLAAADPEACGLRLYVEAANRAAQSTYEVLGMHETRYRLYEEPILRP
jgi:ribosomal protein S18 acetylase RimI-like enzyme